MQLLVSAGLAWTSAVLGQAQIEGLDSSVLVSTGPVIFTFFAVVWSSIKVVGEVSLDAMIAFQVTTAVAAALVDWLLLGGPRPAPRTWSYLLLTLVLAVAAFSMQSALVSVESLVWLGIWVTGMVCHQLSATQYMQTVQCGVSSRVFYISLFNLAPSSILAAGSDLASAAAFSGLTASIAALVMVSAVGGFALQWSSWALLEAAAAVDADVAAGGRYSSTDSLNESHPHISSSRKSHRQFRPFIQLPGGICASIPGLSVLSSLLTLSLNTAAWNLHGPFLAQVLLGLATVSSFMTYQQAHAKQHSQQHQQKSEGKAAGAPKALLAGVVVAVCMALTGGFLAHSAGNSHAVQLTRWDQELELLQNQTHGLELRLEQNLMQVQAAAAAAMTCVVALQSWFY
jgi:hypothetical protein